METQISTDSQLMHLALPIWQFHSTDSLNSGASNKWTPNMEGLGSVVRESPFEVLAEASGDQRGYIVGRAKADANKDFFRKLDSSRDFYAKANRVR